MLEAIDSTCIPIALPMYHVACLGCIAGQLEPIGTKLEVSGKYTCANEMHMFETTDAATWTLKLCLSGSWRGIDIDIRCP